MIGMERVQLYALFQLLIPSIHTSYFIIMLRSISSRLRPPSSVCMLRRLGYRYQTTFPTSQAQPIPAKKPKRPSPYRLLSPLSFLSAFAPLHVQGWRLQHLPSHYPSQSPSPTSGDNAGISIEHGDLQDRRLVRAIGFEEYSELLSFVAQLGKIIQAQDVCQALTMGLTG